MIFIVAFLAQINWVCARTGHITGDVFLFFKEGHVGASFFVHNVSDLWQVCCNFVDETVCAGGLPEPWPFGGDIGEIVGKVGVDQSADRLCNVDSVSELSEETVARLECVLSQERSQESFRLRHREQSFNRGEFATA